MALSSLTAAKLSVPVRTGASLMALTVMLKLWLSASLPPLAVPPLSLTVQVMLPEPLALATVLYFRPCMSASVNGVVVVTSVPSDLNSLMKEGMAVMA